MKFKKFQQNLGIFKIIFHCIIIRITTGQFIRCWDISVKILYSWDFYGGIWG